MMDIDRHIAANGTEAWHWLMINDEWEKEYFSDGTEILVWTVDEYDVLIMNSATMSDKPFSYAIRRRMLQMARKYDKVIVQSDVADSHGMNRLGSYDEENRCFYKGL